MCTVCNSVICRKCIMTSSKIKTICMRCYKDTFGIHDKKILDLKSMKMELTKTGREIPSIATFLEVRDLYEATIVKKKMDIGIHEINAVQYLVLSISEIDTQSLIIEHTTSIQHISTIFSLGNLSSNDVTGLIHLLGVLVTYNTLKTEKRLYNVHKVMPEIMVRFASGSRANGGLRLLHRSARHGTYVHEPDIRDATIKVCKYNNEICIGIRKRVAASLMSGS